MSGLSFGALLRDVESYLRDELLLTPLPDEPALRADFRGHPATLSSRCYQGPAIRFGRATIFAAAEAEIASLAFFPRLDRGAPILGVDLVEHARGSGLVVADLSPVLEGTPVDPTMARAAADLPSAGELPAWARRVFSSVPIFARVGDASIASAAIRTAACAFVSSVRGSAAAGAAIESVREAQIRYVRAHREEDRALGLLGKVFGVATAQRYVREVLFPEVV